MEKNDDERLEDEPLYVNVDPSDPDSEVPISSVGRQSAEEVPIRERMEILEEVASLLKSVTNDIGEAAPPPEPTSPPPRPSTLEARRLELRARGRAGLENRRDGHAKTVDRPVMDIPLSAIVRGRVENVRLEEDEEAFSGLVESLRVEGQLQPIVVVADTIREGKYNLVAGFRRHRAASELGWPTIKATVYPVGTSEQELFFVNAVENGQRFKLSDYEIAARAQLMSQRFDTSLAEYARRMGLSDARVQNLVRYLDTLPVDILNDWRAKDRLLTDHMLQKLAAMPHDEASEFWAGWKSRHSAATAKLSEDRSHHRRSENRPTATMLARAWVAIKRSDQIDEKTRALLLQVVEFCQGHTAAIPEIFDPRRQVKMRAGR